MSVSQYSNKIANFKNRLGHIFAAHVTYDIVNISYSIYEVHLEGLWKTGTLSQLLTETSPVNNMTIVSISTTILPESQSCDMCLCTMYDDMYMYVHTRVCVCVYVCLSISPSRANLVHKGNM